jgi:hypothetical protein
LKKEIEDTNRWKKLLCSFICKIIIVKMVTLLKAIYSFNEILTEDALSSNHVPHIKQSKISQASKKNKSQISKGILDKKSNAG